MAAAYLTTNSCLIRNSIMEQSKQVVISMLKFKIKAFVATNKKKMDWYRKEFMTQPDKRFGGGVGKKGLLSHYKVALPEEDAFFEQDPLNCLIYQQRWDEFLSDCVAMACLHEFLTKEPIEFVDQEIVNKNLKAIPVSSDELERWMTNAASGVGPH
jgi:hypothetical protein